MKKQQDKIAQQVGSVLGACLFVALLIVAIIMLSYVFVVIAIIGALAFVGFYLRIRWLQRKYGAQHGSSPSRNSIKKGRTIDQ